MKVTARLVFTLALASASCAHRAGDAARGDEWVAVRSQHFTLYTNLATRHGWALEQLELAHEVLRSVFFPHTELREVPVVRFANDHHFHDLFGDWRRAAVVPDLPGHTGLGAGGVIVLGTESVDRPVHQVAHRFVQTALPRAPVWFHEGFADYADTVLYYRRDAYFGARCASASRSLAPVPVRQLFAATAEDFDGSQRLRYRASACMLVHLLRHDQGGSLGPGFALFSNTLGSGGGGERAVAAAYPHLTLDALDRALAEHLWLSLSAVPSAGAGIPLPPIAEPIVGRSAVPTSTIVPLVESLGRAGRQARHRFVDWIPMGTVDAAALAR